MEKANNNDPSVSSGPSVPSVDPPPSLAKIAGRNWGGKRPGAGAPKGNLNGFKHGKYSVRHRRLLQVFASMPEVRDSLVAIGERRKRQEKLAQAGASEILAGLLQRAGDIALNPESNHLESNQEFLDFLSRMERQIRTLQKKQSREAAVMQRSIKQREAKERNRNVRGD